MGANAIQGFIDALAARLRRSVAIVDANVRFLYTSPHYGDEDEIRRRAVLQRDGGEAAVGYVLTQGVTSWTTAGVIPASPELGLDARVCVPVRWRGFLMGFLVVLDRESTLTTGELSLLSEAAGDLAVLMLAEAPESVDDESQAVSDAIEDLMASESALWRTATRTLTAHLGRRDLHVRAIALETRAGSSVVAPGHTFGALKHALAVSATMQPPAWNVLNAVQERSASVLVTSPIPLADRAVLDFSSALVDRACSVSGRRFHAVAGVGSGGVGLDHARSSFRQASLAARAAHGPLSDAIVEWSALGELAVMLQLPLGEMDADTLPDEVQTLLAHDRDGREVETVLAYLDHAGSAPSTAEALHIHRTTLYHRLERIREVTGLDLDDGQTRLTLHFGLRLKQVLDRTNARA